jgi:hypothetical protein
MGTADCNHSGVAQRGGAATKTDHPNVDKSMNREEGGNMSRNDSKFWYAVTASASLFVLSSMVTAKSTVPLTRQITETIVHVRTGSTNKIRTHAAEHLFDLTTGIDPKIVDDATLSSMIALLDIPEESVRGLVAASLENLGPRAKTAIPKLLEILALPAVTCPPTLDSTSDGAIRGALTRIGAEPPPLNDAIKKCLETRGRK